MNDYKTLEIQLKKTLKKAIKNLYKIDYNIDDIVLTPPHEDALFATTMPLRIAKVIKKNPFDVATQIKDEINKISSFYSNVVVIKPGFINFELESNLVSKLLHFSLTNSIPKEKVKKQKVLLEFVSANPTGYLHIGSTRNAIFGKVLTRLLRQQGHDVTTEYYVNDYGQQIDILAHSIFARYKDFLDDENYFSTLTDSYQGEEITIAAQQIFKDHNAEFQKLNFEDVRDKFRELGITYFLNKIKEDLNMLNIEFDNFYLESSIYQNVNLSTYLNKLKNTYQNDGALWFKSTLYEDDKDRVLIKKDNSYSYFGPDIFYHASKFKRGFDKAIDILGIDHSGYIPRIKGAMKSELNITKDQFETITLELVKLIENGTEIKMSKRLGTSYYLKDFVNGFGLNAITFYLIDKANNSTINFDTNLVNQKSEANSLFIIQKAWEKNQKYSILESKEKKEKYDFKNSIKVIYYTLTIQNLLQRITNSRKLNLITKHLKDFSNEVNIWLKNINFSINFESNLLVSKAVNHTFEILFETLDLNFELSTKI